MATWQKPDPELVQRFLANLAYAKTLPPRKPKSRAKAEVKARGRKP